jgi:hypothetical protein
VEVQGFLKNPCKNLALVSSGSARKANNIKAYTPFISWAVVTIYHRENPG